MFIYVSISKSLCYGIQIEQNQKQKCHVVFWVSKAGITSMRSLIND